MELVVVVVVCNHKSATSRQPRKLNFSMQADFNPTRRNMMKKLGSHDLELFREVE